MKEAKIIKEHNILIDTNVLINCGREEYGLEFRKILRYLSNNHNDLFVSIVSGFEILKKFGQDKKVVDYYLKLLNYVPNLNLDLEIMNISAYLANEFDQSGKKDNDFMIGGTAIKNQMFLLTSDRGDFNKPFWQIINRYCIEWEDEEKCKIENVYLLEFNRSLWKKEKGFSVDFDRYIK